MRSAERAKERIEKFKPPSARSYYLQSSIRRAPARGAFLLSPFEIPFGVADGSYRIYYSATTNGEESIPAASGPPTVEIYGLADDGPGDSEQSPGAEDTQSRGADKELAKRGKGGQVKSTWKDEPDYRRNRIEHQTELLAHEVTENRMLIGRKFRGASEAVEAAVLNRFYRRELESAANNVVQMQETYLRMQEDHAETAHQMHLRLRADQKPAAAAPAQSNWLMENLPQILPIVGLVVKSLGRLGHDDDESPGSGRIAKQTKALMAERERLRAEVAAARAKPAAGRKASAVDETAAAEAAQRAASEAKVRKIAGQAEPSPMPRPARTRKKPKPARSKGASSAKKHIER